MLATEFCILTVLMGVQMPVMDGLTATRMIRDPNSVVLDHTVRNLAVSAYAPVRGSFVLMTFLPAAVFCIGADLEAPGAGAARIRDYGVTAQGFAADSAVDCPGEGAVFGQPDRPAGMPGQALAAASSLYPAIEGAEDQPPLLIGQHLDFIDQ